MQAIVVAGRVAQQQRRRAGLAGGVATRQEVPMGRGEARREPHRLVPAIGDGREMGPEAFAQRRDGFGQRCREVLVLTTPEAVPGHDDAAAEGRLVVVGCGERGTCLGPQQRPGGGAAEGVEVGADARPIERRDHSAPSRTSRSRLRAPPHPAGTHRHGVTPEARSPRPGGTAMRLTRRTAIAAALAAPPSGPPAAPMHRRASASPGTSRRSIPPPSPSKASRRNSRRSPAGA